MISIRLSRRRNKKPKPPVKRPRVLSCFTWTRTKDNAINSRGLYQLSYEASFVNSKIPKEIPTDALKYR